MIFCCQMNSPVGELLLTASDAGLHTLEFSGQACSMGNRKPWHEESHPIFQLARLQLDEYFSGKRQKFSLPLAPTGTPFQREVWMSLAEIPYGKTIGYAKLAARVHRPSAARAIGRANSRNPLPIVLPCHRVIGADGSLTGYSGGLAIKRFLLRLEGIPVA